MMRRSGAAAVADGTGSGVFKQWPALLQQSRAYSSDILIEPEENAETNGGEKEEEDPLARLARTYKSRFVRCSLGSADARVDVLLCGTLHVTTSSQDFVKDVVATTRPGMVVLEICESRIDSICPPDAEEERMNVTLSAVLTACVKDRSLKTFGMGALTWIQCRAAAFMGNSLGGELAVAAKEAHSVGATVVLGDRLYGVTVQRAFDRLSRFERVKMVTVLTWEVLTMSFFKLSDYIKKSEQDEDFVRREIERCVCSCLL
jgi:pheromone shutdown protein TraB